MQDTSFIYSANGQIPTSRIVLLENSQLDANHGNGNVLRNLSSRLINLTGYPFI